MVSTAVGISALQPGLKQTQNKNLKIKLYEKQEMSSKIDDRKHRCVC